MSFQARPISFKPPRLKALSARLIASHYENNYGGALRRLNAMRSCERIVEGCRRFGAEPQSSHPSRLTTLLRSAKEAIGAADTPLAKRAPGHRPGRLGVR